MPLRILLGLAGTLNYIVQIASGLPAFAGIYMTFFGLIGLLGHDKNVGLLLLGQGVVMLVGALLLYHGCFWVRKTLRRHRTRLCPECGVLAGTVLADKARDREYQYEADESYLEPNGGLYGDDGPQQSMKWRTVTRTAVCREHFLKLRCGRCAHEWQDEYVE